MKVRLKQINLPGITIPKWFQFHEGPIKTFPTILRHVFSILFQFHEGPIKTDLSQRRIFSSKWFQFHEGPIKTLVVLKVLPMLLVSIP